MATIDADVEHIDQNTVRFSYANLANGDVGSPIPEQFSDYADRTAQVKGTPGAGGNVNIEGSLDDGATYATLNDAFGTPLAITAAGIHSINEITPLTRPNVTAGDGTTSLTVIIICRRARSAKEI